MNRRMTDLARRTVATAALLALAVTLTSRPPSVRADAFDVSITDYAFTPAKLTVHVGEPVTWTNKAGRDHTVTSDDGELNSDHIGPGEAYGHVFETAGTYAYHCAIHPDKMQGTITVVAATPGPTTNGTPEPTPPPGTLPPNFSPFPTVDTNPATGEPTPVKTPSPGQSSGGDAGAALPVVIAVSLLILGAGVASYMVRRRA